ncbi:MAG: TlpA family protein disulfide reductase, partial [Kordiimonadaceae bacterium]|nr:TlpA family protein disulfide reductase [Kordiimonadaceae bacterium]
PDFVGRDINGDDTLLSQYKGQVVILNFWHGWVHREGGDNSLPLLEDLYSVEQNLIRGHGENRVKLIASSHLGSFSDFRRKTKKRKSKVDVHFTYDRSHLIGAKYFNLNRVLPITYIIDKKGKIASIHPGYSEEMISGLSRELVSLVEQTE